MCYECYKDEVQGKAADKLKEMFEEESVPKFIRNYFATLGSNKSKLNYWSAIQQLLKWLINNKIINCNSIKEITIEEIDKVRSDDIIDYLDTMKKLGREEFKSDGTKILIKISNSTACSKKNMFSGFWAWMADDEHQYVRRNIMTVGGFNKYKSKDKEIDVPTDEEVESFLSNLEAIKNEFVAVRNIAIVNLFKGSGIRIEELVGLDIDDLYFDNVKDPYVMVMEKGEQEDKTSVRISTMAMSYIKSYLELRNANADNLSKKHLFISENGGRLAQSSIQKFFKDYSNGRIHPHLLRHYAGTKMYENSENDLVGVSEQLRHHDIKTTKKYYVKANAEKMRTALDSL